MTIDIDPQVANLLNRAKQAAESHGMTLAEYLNARLPRESKSTPERQLVAWREFVKGMTELTRHLPKDHFVDDSREAMYDDRD